MQPNLELELEVLFSNKFYYFYTSPYFKLHHLHVWSFGFISNKQSHFKQ